MDVRELKDSAGTVFSPKVSTESVYLKGSSTNLDSKLSSMDNTISGKMNNVTLATVATSGSYTDLSNKPSLAKVATSGSYNDLSNKPTIPDTSGFIPNYGTSMKLGDGTTCSFPSTMNASSVYSWRKAAGGSRDANIMYSSEDGAFFANSGDCGYVFAVYDTDITSNGNFADTSQPAFQVKQAGGYTYSRYGFEAPGFYVSSLRSLKENIEPTKVKATDLINSQEIVDFNYKADEDRVHKVGLIADDSDPLFLDKKGETVDLYNTCGILMKAVQELSKRVEELEQKLN